MYLKSLELQGFKSFPDKIKLTFDKGLTAVVGPNGSGKSNIGDSVRWVLGEQSTKTLRGNKMEDVIFSGTVARKPVGFAMVTLNIDNSCGSLNIEDKEVSITRKLYRSGESEYKINGKNVRLKDINELFMDTGLGRDGYSIIGQGRIAEIVSAKSDERRDIFEEAAGISKFRYKKIEAERRLNAAQENLLRLNDIVSELESRIIPLKLQAEKAEKFVVLAQKKKKLEISVWVMRLEELKKHIDGLEETLLINKSEYENIENDIEREELKIQDGYRKMQQSSVEIEDSRQKILQEEQNSSQYKSDIAVFENDIDHAKQSLESLSKQKNSETNSDIILKTKMAENIKKIEAVENESSKINLELSEIEKNFSDLEKQSENLGKSYDKAGSEINNLYIKQSELKSSINSSQSVLQETGERINHINNQNISTQEKFNEYIKEKIEYEKAACKAEELYVEISNKSSGFLRLYKDKCEQLDKIKKENEGMLFSIREKKQRRKLLNDLESNMEGFARSVKEIMKASVNGRISGIKGTVAQLIGTEQKYAVAVETALGGAMQNIIVENDNIAKRCIRLLKEQRSGRATFLPMTAIRGKKLTGINLHNESGFIALASELVSFDAEYTEIMNYLLGRTVIAEDIDSAAIIAKNQGYKFKIVTLDGQVINSGGSFTGGSASHSSGVISRKNELESLNKEIIELTSKQLELEPKFEKLKADAQRVNYEFENLKEEQSNIASDKIKFEAELSKINTLSSQTESLILDYQNEIKRLTERSKKEEDILKEYENKLKSIYAEIEDAEKNLSDEKGKKESVQSKREELASLMSSLKIKSIEYCKDKEALIHEQDSLNQTKQEYTERKLQIDAEERRLNAIIEDKGKLINERKSMLEEIHSNIIEHNVNIKNYQKIHTEQDMHINELRNGMKNINDAKEKLSREISRIEERKLSSQRDYDNIISELYEIYQITRSEAINESEKIDDISAAQKELNETKIKIRSLGNVNVGAIEEYKEVSERYDFLAKQLSDVRTSKRELEKLISELMNDMCRIFAESFAVINQNFKEIFVELFGGGKAELTLTDPDNILESGIEIRVAPPGKVIKNLISLSGGEQSFVAICIYFAILKLRPSPFCLLDEIDAALDEVNVRKYAQYLKKFTAQTQFILVTHRRSAMEEANVLYGVTMQEDGVSKLLKMEQPDLEGAQAN